MTRVAILTPNLTPADAVSNDVLAMESLLSDRGHEVCVFAEHANLEGRKIAEPSETRSFLQDTQDVLIYHHSIGWERGIEIVKNASCRKAIKYHNVTPPQFFAGISEEHQHLCAAGRRQLLDIVDARCDLYMAASDFNKTDLLAAGSEDKKTFVVPPFNHADKLQAGEADLELVDEYSDGAVNLVTVGGVRPNKSHQALIKAFMIYLRLFNRNARLFIVGAESEAFAKYTASVRELIDEWGIEPFVVFTGKVSDECLKAYYLVADALVMTSEHEGFCVPLVEAMAMKVPIIAYGSTAIPETAGGSGLICDRRDPFLMAHAIDSLTRDEKTKMALVSRGAQRYEERFSNAAIAKRFLEVMEKFIF